MKKQIWVVLLAIVMVMSLIACVACQDDPATYTLTYAAGEGSGTAPEVESYKEGETVTIKANPFTAPANKEFDGWSDGTTKYQANGTLKMPAANVTLTAQWKDKLYTVTYKSGEGSGDDIVREYHVGDTVVLLTAADCFTAPDNKEFDCWLVKQMAGSNANAAEGAEISMPSCDIVITAQWRTIQSAEPTKYTVSYVSGEGSGTAPEVESYKEGETVTIKANPFAAPEDKEFDGWSDGVNRYQVGDTFKMPAANVTLTAQWKSTPPQIVHWTLMFFADKSDSEAFTSLTFEDGEIVTEARIPELAAEKIPADMEFDCWQTLEGKKLTAGAVITANEVYYAKLVKSEVPTPPQPATVKVTFQYENGEIVKSADIVKGQKLTAENMPSITAPEGKMLDGWYDNGIKFDLDVPIENDITLTAKFVDRPGDEKGEYTIIIDEQPLTMILDGFGSITGSVVDGATDQTYIVIGKYIVVAGVGITLDKGAETADIAAPVNGGVCGTFRYLVSGTLSNNLVLMMYDFGALTFNYYGSAYSGEYSVSEGKIIINGIHSEINGEWLAEEDGNVLTRAADFKIYVEESYDLTSHLEEFSGKSNGRWADENNNLVITVNIATRKVVFGGETIEFTSNLNATVLTFYADYNGGSAEYTLTMQNDLLVISRNGVKLGEYVAYSDSVTVLFVGENGVEEYNVKRGGIIDNPPADLVPEQGYVFAGWFAGIVRFDTNMSIDRNMTFVAKFAAEQTEEITLNDLVGEWTLSRQRYTITETTVTYFSYDRDSAEWFEEDVVTFASADFADGKLTLTVNGDDLIFTYNPATNSLAVTDEWGDTTEYPNTAKPVSVTLSDLVGEWTLSRQRYTITETTVTYFSYDRDSAEWFEEDVVTFTSVDFADGKLTLTVNGDDLIFTYNPATNSLAVTDEWGDTTEYPNTAKPETFDLSVFIGAWENADADWVRFEITETTVACGEMLDGIFEAVFSGALTIEDNAISFVDFNGETWSITYSDGKIYVTNPDSGFDGVEYSKVGGKSEYEPTTYIGEWFDGNNRLVIDEATVSYYYMLNGAWLLVDAAAYSEQNVTDGRLYVTICGVEYTIEYIGSAANGYRVTLTDTDGVVKHYLPQGKEFMFGTWQGSLNGQNIDFISTDGTSITVILGSRTIKGDWRTGGIMTLDGTQIEFIGYANVTKSVFGCNRFVFVDNGDGTVTAYASDSNQLTSDNASNVLLTFKNN